MFVRLMASGNALSVSQVRNFQREISCSCNDEFSGDAMAPGKLETIASSKLWNILPMRLSTLYNIQAGPYLSFIIYQKSHNKIFILWGLFI